MIPLGLPTSVGLVGFCVIAEVARELGFKVAADAASASPRYAVALAAQPLLWLGVALWLAETIAWLLVLQHVPLSLAFPAMMLVYASIPMASAIVLKERLSRDQVVGACLVVFGVTCVSVSELGAFQ